MTQSDLAIISSFDKPKIHAMLKGESMDSAMRLRYELHKALAVYAKGKGGSQSTELDHVQTGALKAAGQIESWCRHAFYKRRIAEILRQDGDLLKTGKKAAKWQVRKEWETLCQRLSY